MRWIFPKFQSFAPHSLLPICLLAAIALAAWMATVSEYNRHPDEFHHFEAARYYKHHFLPPEIGDETVRASYSVYGVSYLNYHWLEYLAAGKFIFLTAPVFGDDLLAARFFNVFLLFTLLVFFAYRARKYSAKEFIIPCFLLVTPQIWYVFSYVNNDAFALAASLLAAQQIAQPTSLTSRFLRAETFSKNLIGGLVFGCLVGVLLIVKTNYYAFLIFAALWLLYRFPLVKFIDSRPRFDSLLLKKFTFVSLIGLSILTFRCGLDFYVNGETNFVGLSYANYFLGNFEDQKSRLLEYQEAVAELPYKPSTVEKNLSGTDPSLKLKEKGKPFSHLFKERRWHEDSFKSFVGIYGYMNVLAGFSYYRLMQIFYTIFAVYLFVAVAARRKTRGIWQSLIYLAGFALTVFISAYLSWSYAYQAQGRYLFPIVAMTGVLVYANRARLDNLFVHAFIAATFLASVYSFIWVAIAGVNP